MANERSSRPIIQKIVALAAEADEEGYPIIGLALLALARVSLLDLPESVCRMMVNSCVAMADAVIETIRWCGRPA